MKTAQEIEQMHDLPAGSVTIITEGGVTRIDYGTTLAGKKIAKLEQLAEARWQEQNAGIEVHGYHVKTTKEVHAGITEALIAQQTLAGLNLPNPEIDWKIGGNVWMEVDINSLKELAVAMYQHNQLLFGHERQLQNAVAEANTEDELEAIEWVSPYDSLPNEEEADD